METIERIGVIGLGSMGLPMASTLAAAGFTVAGFDPAPERVALAERDGVAGVADGRSAATGADVLLLAVRDEAQARAALFGPRGCAESLPRGSAVVVTSTIGREAVLGIGHELAERGVLTVDAPVSGGPGRAGTGDLLVIVSGSAEALEQAEPVIAAVAGSVEPVGERLGDAQAMKIVNQLLCGIHIAAAAEALALADQLGLDQARALEILGKGAAASFMLADRGARMVAEGPRPVNSRIDIFVKDMGMVLEAARGELPLPVAGSAEQLYALAARSGWGGMDDSELVDFLRGTSPHGPKR
jgi:3-hydroxyisobutyrate dehydrogenase